MRLTAPSLLALRPVPRATRTIVLALALAFAALTLVAGLGRVALRGRSSPYAAPAATPAVADAKDAAADADAALPLPNASSVVPDAAATMVVRSGSASIEVDSVGAAITRVRALAAQVGGFVANASLAAGRQQVRSATLELKVPAARYDELVNGLAPIGRVETVNVAAEDVGEEYVDVAAREANARRLEERLVALLAQRAGRLTDVLAVERELARVREEIERYDGRIRWLRAHAAMSTLAVTVHEPPPLVGPSPAAQPIAEAF